MFQAVLELIERADKTDARMTAVHSETLRKMALAMIKPIAPDELAARITRAGLRAETFDLGSVERGRIEARLSNARICLEFGEPLPMTLAYALLCQDDVIKVMPLLAA